MSSYKRFSELRDKLLPHNSDPWRGNVGPFLGDQSTSRSLPDFQVLPPWRELHEADSVEKQKEYLRSLTENVTDGYLMVNPGQSTQSSLFLHQQDSILDAITSGQEFPGSSSSTSLNSSSGFVDSNSEILSSSSMLSFGDISATPGMGTEISSCLEPTPSSLTTSFRHSQQPPLTSVGIGSVTSHRDHKAYEATKDMGSSGHEGSDLVGVNPFDSGTEIDIHQYMIHDLEVIFSNLENHVFEKQQSRKDKQARQRITNGKVKFLIRSDHPVKDVRAWVRREIKAAQLEGDTNGMVALETVFLRKNADNNLEYQVDLDSVYEVAGSNRPVYKLAKVHTQERNQFELLVQVVYADNQVSEQIASKPFLIKTKRMNEEPAEPVMYSKEKRKRPNTCPSSSSRWSPQGKHRAMQATQHTLQNEPDSTGSMSPLSSSSLGSRNSSFSLEGASQLDQLVVKHLKAQQANIDKLSFGCMMQTSKGDIAYHLKLTNPDKYHNHEEGVVVGFFPDDEGMATIEPLSDENAPQAVMAGVISRSAYLEAHAPLDTEKGQTDIVCVIGMVKVQIVGSVRTGERIYASTEDPGTGIPESHLPLGAFIIRNHTLLGMAMETCKSRRHGEVNLVKCFVCIVLGINSHQLATEVENILESIDMDIKVAIGKSNKTTCRRMSLLIVGLVLFLGVFGFFVYQLLTPGSLFRYYLCRIGSCSDHHLNCDFTSREEELVVPFIQFEFDTLKEKIPHGIIPPTKMNSSSAMYFLNYDRCAYGGRTDGIKYTLEKGKIVRGPTFLASNGDCSEQFIFERGWRMLKSWGTTHGNESLTCACSGAGDFTHQWIAILLSFAMTCVIKDLF